MRFDQSLLDEIRTRIPVSEVVGRRVKLKRAGRGWSGLCPFHQEKTPSFGCDDGRQTYKCFGCGKGGDIFRFVMETEGLSFPEAVERLAGEAGVALPKPEVRDEERERKRAGLHDVLEEACRFFEAVLADRRGDHARDYLARRGLALETQQTFRIGYAPNSRNALREHLAAKNVSQAMMIEAGLLVAGEDIATPYDRFRDRVIFPIQDSRGRIVAFGGRALSKDVQAKYLNSPETPLFHKGRMLFNAHRARSAARIRGRVIAVEGYVDVIACSAVGLAEAVAPLGTAMTADQLTDLWRMADEPILCFDGDPAGLKAMNRVIDLALPLLEPGRSLRFAVLPDGQDPDDLIRSGGVAAMEAVLAHAESMIERLWARERGAPIETPEQRAGLEVRIAALVGEIRNEMVRKHYTDLLRRKVYALFSGPKRSDFIPGQRRRPVASSPRGPQVKRHETQALISESLRNAGFLSAVVMSRREAVILGTLINHPTLVAEHAETIHGIDFESRELDDLKGRLLELAFAGADGPTLRARLEDEGYGPLIRRMDDIIRRLGLWQAKDTAPLDDAETGWRQAVLLQKRSRTLHSELKEAEAAFAQDGTERSYARVNLVREELLKIETEAAATEGFGADFRARSV